MNDSSITLSSVRALAFVSALPLLVTGACDLPPPSAGVLPPRIVTSSIEPGPRGYAEHPARAPVWIEFDRLLLPRSVSRATVLVVSGELSLTPRLRYDPALRRVRIELSAGELRPDLEYEVRVRQGVTSWDGAVSDEARAFRVRFVDRIVAPERTPTLRTDVAPMLAAHCGSAACHGGDRPAMGLDLSSPEGIVRTSSGVPSTEWPSPSGAVERGEFGWAGFVRVSPGEPAESYLVYKLLGDGPVRGAAMPRGAAALTSEQIRVVSAWIAAGARDELP